MSVVDQKPAITMEDVLRHRRMCTDKRKRFHTELEGRLYLLRRKFRTQRLYPCPYCSGFHFTRLPKKSEKECLTPASPSPKL